MSLVIKRLDLASQGLLPRSLRGIDLDSTAWYALDEPGGRAHPDLDQILSTASALRPDVDVFYGDEVVFDPAHPAQARPLLKSSFDLTHLIAQDYVGWMLLARGRRLIAYCDTVRDADFCTYGLLLHCAQHDARVERVPEALSVRPRARTHLPSQARRRLLEHWAREAAPDCSFLDGIAPDSLRIQRRLVDPPLVALVVPTCQAICSVGTAPYRDRPHILNLLESLGDTDWPLDRLSVIVGDDAEDDALYARTWPFEIRRVNVRRSAGEPFNYAAKMNQLWRMAPAEYLVFMNDDLIPQRRDWLRALMTFAMDPEVGGVGARLLYPDGRIQHAGMAGGVMGSCTHVFIGQQASVPTYGGWAEVHREWSMVTGAVFATRKTLLERMNGYDERFTLEFNDIDLCLRMRQLGLRIVYTPFAELTHFESASRGSGGVLPSEIANFLERWRGFLTDDPAYHPGMVKNTSWVIPEERQDVWWRL
jgi:O-antigen biosynthesis protein